MKTFVVSVAALLTIALLFRDYFGPRARWAYGGVWFFCVLTILGLTRSLLLLGAAQALLAAAMLIHLKLVHNIDL